MDRASRRAAGPLPRRSSALLSGGNQQKVVLAKWLRRRPAVLLLDEPSQGVDVGAKAVIHALAREVAQDGACVVIASSDDAELCDTCDRVLVMRDGRIVAESHGRPPHHRRARSHSSSASLLEPTNSVKKG